MTETDARDEGPMRAAPRRRRFYDNDYISFALPPMRTGADVVEASNAVIEACASGRLTLREATGLISLITRHAKLIELVDLEKREATEDDPSTMLYEEDQAWARAVRGELDDLPAPMPNEVQRSAPAAPRTPVERASCAVGETHIGDATVQRPSPIQSRRTPADGTSETEMMLHAMGKFDGPEPGKAVAADPLELGTFCARVGNLYGKHGLSPPFELRTIALAWLADGIDLSHCLDVVEQHLRDHAASCRSGSGDRLLAWLDQRVRHSWSCLHPDLGSDRVRDRSPLI
jgi:hypothetical protein